MNMLLEKTGLCILIIAGCGGATAQEYFANKKVKSTEEQEYQLVKKAHDIELYERWYEVKEGQQARVLKAVYTLRVPADSAVALVANEPRILEWNANTTEGRIMRQDDTSWIIYLRYNLPWPMDDQDCVLQYVLAEEPSSGIVTMTFKSVKQELFPEKENISRIPDIKGKWILTPTSDGIKTEYFITTTPSMSLPRWITDPIIRNNLIDTMRAFRNILEGTDD